MDNNELDKIIKEKLKDTIIPSKELENKIAKKIEEQKNTTFEKVEKQPKKKSYKRFAQILSFAAVFVIVFTFGVLYKNQDIDSLIPGTNESSNEVVTIKAIKPTKLESGIVAKDSEFIITVEDDKSSVKGVQKSLYLEPALEYEITKTGNKEYKLKFKQNIPDNTILKLQYVKNQITEDSWAYQTNTNLSVSKTFPANESNYVSPNTTIEVELSYANVDNFEENVSIFPKVDGKWNHLGKIWRFTPNKALSDGKYSVVINKEIKAENKEMDKNYKFSFTVGENTLTYYHRPLSNDNINTFSEKDQIVLFYSKNGDKSDIGKVILRKFLNADEFINYLQNDDYSNSEVIGNYEFEDNNTENDDYITLKKTLSTGYYVASIQNSKGVELFTAPIQINNLQAYALETERDVIVWVAKDGKLAEGIEIEYLENKAKTNKDGIASFKADGSTNIKYAKIGNDDEKIVVGFNNFTHENYPESFIYTDRPLYKNNDNINIWGFVPRNLFFDKIDENEFYIELDGKEKNRISVDKNGSFKYKIDLKNQKDGYYSIALYYKNKQIGYKGVVVENYELQNYEYEIIANKNYAYVGENFEFDVKVKHITGILVPGKAVIAEYNGKKVREVTNDKGIAHISFTASETYSSNRSVLREQSIYIYNGDIEEYTNAINSLEVFVLAKDTYTEINNPKNEKDTKYNINLYKLINNKNINIEKIEELYDGVYEAEIDIFVEEEINSRYISGYRYNEYTKQNEPEYNWNTSIDRKKINTIKTNNGKFEFDRNTVKMKEDSEEKWYSYKVEFEYKDRNGRIVQDEIYLYHPYIGKMKAGYWDETDYYNSRYCIYRYFFDEEEYDYNNRKFKIGDSVNLKLKESTSQGEKEIKNEGKVLRVVFKQDIKRTDLIENNDFDYVFTNEDENGVKITGAYFVNGKFYRMPTKYFEFDGSTKKINVEITADKEKYSPGDKVTLNIKTTNSGKPIKASLNISVVNEAVFALKEDEESTLLDTIYRKNEYPAYTFSSYLDILENNEPGKGGGGGGEPRGKFSDTAYFDTVETDEKGVAKVSFSLPDNVTTYRVTAHAANKELYLGENTEKIVSTLDFFVQYTAPRGVKSSDDLVLTATSIADNDYKVDYEFTIEELNKTLKTSEVTNKMASVNFGKINVGKYHAIIKGTDGKNTDSVKFEFEIVESTQEVLNKTTININEQTNIKPSKNPITLEIYNKQMKQYMDYIDFIEETNSSRLDTRIAYNEVQSLKKDLYGIEYAQNEIDIKEYIGENNRFKNLKDGSEDLVLSALIKYYTEYDCFIELSKDDNLYEYYLYLSSQNKPVLEDLKYLKEVTDTDNYNKLLLTLSFEFLGDYENARLVYNDLKLTDSEKEEYSSIIAIIDTFINKNEAILEINKLIDKKPSDEYLRFAILSFFRNNSKEIAKEENIKIISNTINETVSINGLKVKKYTIYDSDLSEIKFETTSNDIFVTYYYQTSIENVENDKISKDITIKLDGKVNKNNQVDLVIDFSKIKNQEGEVRISLPNNLRLDTNYNKDDENYYKYYYLENNRINYLTYYKQKNCSKITIPLIVSLDGNYIFENIVFTAGDGMYHISNSIEIK